MTSLWLILVNVLCSHSGNVYGILGWPKSSFFPPKDGSSGTDLSLPSFETILLDCIVTAVTSTCIKKLIKIGEFLCSHFNIEVGRKYAIFLAYDALLF